jgi:transcriptional regulator with XRE-family HTH domain
LANKLPNLSQNENNKRNFNNFSEALKYFMETKHITQSDLAKTSTVSKTTISRMLRNSNDKGSTYLPSEKVIVTIGVGLGLTKAEKDELIFAAFPEKKIYEIIFNERLTLDQANELLYESGLPLLGNIKE